MSSHGEHGHDGSGGRGIQGNAGVQGKTGATGKTGARGESSPYLGKNQTLALAAFIFAAFVLLSIRSEINSDQISANAARIIMTQQAACESGREILAKYNAQQDALIAIEQANPDVDPTTQAARIRAYEAGRIDPLPVCDPLR